MPLLLFFLLIGMPILEIFVIVKAGGAIGWLSVIGLTILTAVVGTAVIRWQGLTALRQVQSSMADGRVPVAPAIDGVFLIIAAPLLMTPGFVTDAFGFLILIPAVRHALARAALRRLKRAADDGRVTIIRS